MAHTTKLKFRELQARYNGRIILKHYGPNASKTLVFSPVADQPSAIGPCSACGKSVSNATNFGCLVHFCPDRELTVEISDFNTVPA